MFLPADQHDRLPEERLPADGRYLLLSDLHLGDGGPTDIFGDKDEDLLALLEARLPGLDAVVLGGDVLDATQAARAEQVARAHPQLVARLEELAGRLPLYHLAGNHDSLAFISALLPSTRLCRSVQIGEETLVIHGHELDIYFHRGPLDGRGQLSLRAHARVERLTGQLIRLPFAHHDNPTNRFAHWVFYRATMALHLAARIAARLGDDGPLRGWAAHHDFWARSQWGDSSAVLLPALQALARGPHSTLVAGHTHQPGVVERVARRPTETVSGQPDLSWRPWDRRAPDPADLEGKAYVNLGSWTLEQTSYALWEHGALRLHDWRLGPVDGRSYRFALDAASIPGMREWWRRYYRGLGRYDTAAVRRDRREIDEV